MESSEQGGTGENALLEVLIAQLYRNGILSGEDIENMKRRLIEGGDEDIADNLGWIIFSDIIDDPEARRAAVFSIDGGKAED